MFIHILLPNILHIYQIFEGKIHFLTDYTCNNFRILVSLQSI